MNLDLLTIDAARSAVQERKTTAAALAESFYAKIQSDDPKIGAFLTFAKIGRWPRLWRWTLWLRRAKSFRRWVASPSRSKM